MPSFGGGGEGGGGGGGSGGSSGRKPPIGWRVRVDWDNLLTQKMVFAALCNGAGSCGPDMVFGDSCTNGGTSVVTIYGGARSFNGTSDVATYGNRAEWIPSGSDMTLMAMGNPISEANARTFLAKRKGTSPFSQYALLADVDQSGNAAAGKFAALLLDGTTQRNSSSTNTVVDGANHIYGATIHNGDGGWQMYLDGVTTATTNSTSNTGAFPSYGGTDSLAIGGNANSGNLYNKTLHFCYVWMRALTAREMWEVAQAPFVLFTYELPISFFFMNFNMRTMLPEPQLVVEGGMLRKEFETAALIRNRFQIQPGGGGVTPDSPNPRRLPHLEEPLEKVDLAIWNQPKNIPAVLVANDTPNPKRPPHLEEPPKKIDLAAWLQPTKRPAVLTANDIVFNKKQAQDHFYDPLPKGRFDVSPWIPPVKLLPPSADSPLAGRLPHVQWPVIDDKRPADPAPYIFRARVTPPGSTHYFTHQLGSYQILNNVTFVEPLVRGSYRVQNLATAGYVAYVGVNQMPDLSGDPTTFSASLPMAFAPPTAPPAGQTTVYYVVLRKRDSYGLVSQNQRPYVVVVGPAGTGLLPPLDPPDPVLVFPASNGGVRVMATYAGVDTDQYPADKWRVWVNTTVPDPDLDVPDVEADVRGPNFGVTLTGYPAGDYFVSVVLYRTSDGARSPEVTLTVTVPPQPDEPGDVHTGFEIGY